VIGPAALLLTSRQVYAETDNIFICTCIFGINKIISRHEVLKTLDVDRYKVIGVIMLDYKAIYYLMSMVCSPDVIDIMAGSDELFGAVRAVYVLKTSVFAGLDMLVQNR
jgi:hypothetical protein